MMATSPIKSLLEAAQMIEETGGGGGGGGMNINVTLIEITTPPRPQATAVKFPIGPPPPPSPKVQWCHPPSTFGAATNPFAFPSLSSLPHSHAQQAHQQRVVRASGNFKGTLGSQLPLPKINLRPRYSGSGRQQEFMRGASPQCIFPHQVQGVANPTVTTNALYPTVISPENYNGGTRGGGNNNLQDIHPPLVRGVASAASPAQVLPEEEEEEVEEPAVTAPGPERITFPSDDEDEDEEKSTTAVLPEDISLPALFDEDDIPFINPSHYIIGTDILEAFVVKQYDVAAPLKKTQKQKPNFRAGSVAFRCRYCKHAQHKKQPNAILYPESLGGLYRANLRFQSNHVSNCLLIPHWLRLKLHRTRRNSNVGRQRLDQIGIRDYWVVTAARKGFKNAEGKKGLTFSLPY